MNDDDRALHGALAPPTENGELAFEAPWQGRAFATARALCDAGLFTWDEFRASLIAAIRDWEAQSPPDAEYRYYDRFLEALTALVTARGIIEAGALEGREQQLLAAPPDHHHAHE